MLRSVLCDKLLSSFANMSIQQTRNTYILKRRYPPKLTVKGKKIPKMKNRQFIYDIVKVTENEKHPRIKVILTKYVEGIGDVGDIVELGPYQSYKRVLLPQAGVYCTPENMLKFSTDQNNQKAKKFSTPFVEKTMRNLNQMSLPVLMNYYNEWTLEPWHIKVAFRNNGYHVPDYAITLPENPIRGPNLELEEKEFLVTVTLNKTEKTRVRCRIFHYAIGNEKRDMPLDFLNVPKAALFPEEEDILANMPLPEYKPPKVDSRFGLARKRVPRRMKGHYYVLDYNEKSYYDNFNPQAPGYNKKI